MTDEPRIESSAAGGDGASSPLDSLSESVARGERVDWDAAETGAAGARQRSQVEALRGIERIAEYHRELLRSSSRPAADPGGPEPPRSRPWGDLIILELASAGASGEVWRAWDAWLQRDVALKFLLTVQGPAPRESGASPLLDEARALARVRHPGVVAVHGIAEHDGRVGMWMEFLTGRTLAAEIEQHGPMAPREVARIGLALCEALEAVAAAGLVHRDIKPANIVLEPQGRVVLTDFGLGRRWELAGPETWRGSGTPLFMSPGQLSGQSATPRSDIYALGVTLRWALTGRPPFRARTLEELKAESAAGPAVPLATERPDAPAALVAVIARAMAPAPEARYADAAEMARDLRAMLNQDAAGSRTRRALAITGLAVLALGAAWAAPRLFRAPTPALPSQFTVTAPAGTVIGEDASQSSVSPDGRLLAFTATDSSGVRRLWIRSLGSLEAHPLPGTERVDLSFWSPDSRNIGFFAEGKLKKIPVQGGAAEVLCAAHDPRGGNWGTGGVILFAPEPAGPICAIPAEGGDVTAAVKPDTSRKETALRWPQFLPDGRHFLFASLPGREHTFDIYAGALGSSERRFVLRSEAAPICAGDHDLIVVQNGHLMDQPFDFRNLRAVGEPVSLGAATSADVSVAQPLASASMNGVLVRPAASLANTQLAWLDRSGRVVGALSVPEGRYERMFFSPDGRQLIAMRRSSSTTVDLWKLDVRSGQGTRFSAGSQTRIGGRPVWSPDGKSIAFSSNRAGPTNIYRRATTGSAEEELLYGSDAMFKEVDAWSPDGRLLVFEETGLGGWDIWLLPLDGDRKPTPYLRSRFSEVGGAISPDGRWMAYCCDETGRPEIYVRSFPLAGAESRVSTDGGIECFWSQSGRELIITSHNADDSVWSVPVTTGPTFKAGRPRLLFKSQPGALWVVPTPRGDRFLESVPVLDAPPSALVVEMNWRASLAR